MTTEFENGSAGERPSSFWQTIELKPRSTYFAALLREDTDNFFGPLVSPASTTQTLTLSNLAGGQGVVDVVLQGVTRGQQHDVTVALNGATLGDLNFTGQQEVRSRFTVPDGVLANGANTITLTAQQGSNDISLVNYVDVSYRHTYTAEADQLKFSAHPESSITVSGFVNPPTRLIDVTNPQQPFAVSFQTSMANGAYQLSAQIPWSSSGTRWLFALSDTQIASPVSLLAHHPSNLHDPQRGAEVLMLTAPQFTAQVAPLAALRQAEGKSVALVSVDDVYDEFNF